MCVLFNSSMYSPVFAIRQDLRNKLAVVGARMHPHCKDMIYSIGSLPVEMKISDVETSMQPEFKMNVDRYDYYLYNVSQAIGNRLNWCQLLSI